MGKLRVPSLQHLARTWHPDPHRIKRVLLALANGGPSFSYEPIFQLVRDMLLFGTPYEQVVEGVRRGVKREDVRQNFLGLLPLVRDYFEGVAPAFVHAVSPRLYSVGRGLMIPFNPPLIYGADGQLHFPWFSFWRTNPLATERLSLFVTIVEEVLLQDSDLEGAHFTILDFSSSTPDGPRKLRVVDTRAVQRLSPERKAEMLMAFAQGFQLAKEASPDLLGSVRRNGLDELDDDQLPLDI